ADQTSQGNYETKLEGKILVCRSRSRRIRNLHDRLGEASGKRKGRAASRKTWRRGNGAPEILSRRMGLHRNIRKIQGASGRRPGHRRLHQQAGAGRKLAGQYIPYARALRRFRGAADSDLGSKRKSVQAVWLRERFCGSDRGNRAV